MTQPTLINLHLNEYSQMNYTTIHFAVKLSYIILSNYISNYHIIIYHVNVM